MRVPLKLHGLARDPDPSELPPDIWSAGNNVRVSEQQMRVVSGATERLVDPGDRVHWMINARGASSWWVYHTDAGIYQTTGSSGPTNIATTSTPTDFALTGAPWKTSQCSGGLLHNVPYMLCGNNPPVYWPLTGNCLATANWDDYGAAAGTAGVLWTFKNHIFCGDVQGDESRVAWTAAIEAGTPAADWEVLTTNEAGFVDLSDTRGAIQNGLSLGRSCMIYKDTGGAYLCDYVGGNQVFSFRLFSRELSLVARHGVCDIDGGHVLLTNDDVILTDGQSARSIIDGSNRRALFSEIDADNIGESWLLFNRAKSEVWICYPTGGNQAANRAAIYDMASGRWGWRSLGRGAIGQGVTFAARGIVEDSAADFEWDSYGGSWAAAPDTWDAAQFNPSQESVLSAELTNSTSDDGVFAQLDVGTTDSAGNDVNAALHRYGLDFGEPDSIKTVRSIHVNASGGGTITGHFGARMTEAAATQWGPMQVIDLNVRQQIDGLVSGRLIDVELYMGGDMSVAGVTVEVAGTALQ